MNVRSAVSSRLALQRFFARTDLVPSKTSISRRSRPGSAAISWKLMSSMRSEEHTSELQSPYDIVCRLLLEKKITIEDPVEYQLPGVLQIPVNEQKGLTFARGLRSILRHDPDRIMVGEIRYPETAEIAVQFALTGHLVYTTVHANNAFDVLGRFMHMGVDPYNLVSALNAVLAQRLVRIYCTACRGSGCAQCRGTGYRGRKAIGELLVLNDELRELIIARAPARKRKGVAR